jgi:hypothetical protein
MKRDKIRKQMGVLKAKQDNLLVRSMPKSNNAKPRPVVKNKIIQVPAPIPRRSDPSLSSDAKVPKENTNKTPKAASYGYKTGCQGCGRKAKKK